MCASELKSHITLLRLDEQKKLMAEASKAVASTLKINNLISQTDSESMDNIKDELEDEFMKLKKDIDAAKMISRKIKSIVDTDNIVEEMNRLFYILKDNLKDVFVGQLKLREEISKIDEIQSIKLSFIR